MTAEFQRQAGPIPVSAAASAESAASAAAAESPEASAAAAADGPQPAAPRGLDRQAAVVAVVLVAATGALFLRSTSCDFIFYDDNFYVTKNPWIQQGLTWDNLRWAFDPQTYIAANWHPLTLVSHMLDCQLFDLAPWGHHLTSVAWHAVNTGLVFLLFRQMTGRVWPSVLVAALFGWHPLRVESVTWVAERKDVLSAFFGLLCLSAYVAWTRRGGLARYGLTAGLLLAGLLSKSMLVTWPCLMLLLDYWPLGRIALGRPLPAGWFRTARGLVVEKLPLAALVALFAVQTFRAQKAQGAVRSAEAWPWSRRVVDCALSYTEYVNKLLVPLDLAVLYPSRSRIYSLTQIAATAVALAAITWLVVVHRRRGYLPVGWFWFLGTLVPVIGIVPFGAHSIADRYSYLPSIGLYLIVAWGLADLAARRPRWRPAAVGVAAVWLAVLAGLTWIQIGHWRDTRTLFAHTVAVTRENYLGHKTLANAYVEEYESQLGEMDHPPDRSLLDRAVEHYHRSLAIEPNYRLTYYNLAYALRTRGELEAAAPYFQRAIDMGLDDPTAWAKYGETLWQLGRCDAARAALERALALDPGSTTTAVWLAVVIALQGDAQQAAGRLEQLLAAHPDAYQAAGELARIRATHPVAALRNAAEARALALQACEGAAWSDPDYLAVAAAAAAEAGQFPEAVSLAQRALELARLFRDRDPLLDRLIARLEVQLARYRAGQQWYDLRLDPQAAGASGGATGGS